MTVSTAVPADAAARVMGIKTVPKFTRRGNIFFLPQRIALIGQGSTDATYSLDKRQINSAQEAGLIYGYGSPIHLAARQFFPRNGDGVRTIPVTVYPLEDAASGVVSTGEIIVSGTATSEGIYLVLINDILSEPIAAEQSDDQDAIAGKIVTAINAVLQMPVKAALKSGADDTVELFSKWKGESANDIKFSVEGPPTTIGITFAITAPTGGANNPDVEPALNGIGNRWETLILNCLNVSDAATLDKYANWGEGRWGALTHRHSVVFSGQTKDLTSATAISDVRKEDRVNVQLTAPKSEALPFVVAAAELARIALVANENPPADYGSQAVPGIKPGKDGEQWDYVKRNSAVNAGTSTIDVRDGVIHLSDTVTFYHPTGDELPAYRYVVDIIKLQNIVFNTNLIFNRPEWDGAPLIPDNQATVNPRARQPKAAIAAVSALIANLALQAIISNPNEAKASIRVEIDSQNPKRLNLTYTVQLSGNTNIISVDLNFGFYFGAVAGVNNEAQIAA